MHKLVQDPLWRGVRCTLERLEVQIPDLSAAEENASDKTRRKQAKDSNRFRGGSLHQDQGSERMQNTLAHMSTHTYTQYCWTETHTCVESYRGLILM